MRDREREREIERERERKGGNERYLYMSVVLYIEKLDYT